MKHLFSHRSLPLLVSVTLGTVTLPVLPAEPHTAPQASPV